MMKDIFPQSMSGSICLDKIDKQYIFEYNGKRYLNLRFKFTPDNNYGNDYMITQDVDKETRLKCKETGQWPETPILGNCKAWDGQRSAAPAQESRPAVASASDDEGLPF